MGANASADESQPGDDQEVAELRDHHRHHHRGGVTQFIAMSLDNLGVDQSRSAQVDKLQDDLWRCLAPTRGIEGQLVLAVADGVAAGKPVSSDRVEEAVARLDSAAASMPECSADALNQLHAVLTPSERAALTDRVEDHWAVWRDVNGDAEAKAADRRAGRVAELTRDLSLRPEQADQIATALEAARAARSGRFDRKSTEANLEEFCTVFSSETFDARRVALTANAPLMATGARRMAGFYETVTPILTPDQRATLAKQLRQHANHQPAVSAL
jgi:Spy/CpxP family protein refolding chaperone